MAWLSRGTNGTGGTSYVGANLSYTFLDDIAADLRTYGGPVNANGQNLSAVGAITVATIGAGSGATAVSGVPLRTFSADTAILFTHPTATKACTFNFNLGGQNTVEGGLVIQRRTTANGFEANLGYLNVQTGNLGIGNILPLTKLHVTGGNVAPAGEVGGLLVTGSSVANRLAIGFDETNNFAWLQAVQNGVDNRPLKMNPNGSVVVLHAPSGPLDGALSNGQCYFYLQSNTSFRVRARGSDGTVREGTITLS